MNFSASADSFLRAPSIRYQLSIVLVIIFIKLFNHFNITIWDLGVTKIRKTKLSDQKFNLFKWITKFSPNLMKVLTMMRSALM